MSVWTLPPRTFAPPVLGKCPSPTAIAETYSSSPALKSRIYPTVYRKYIFYFFIARRYASAVGICSRPSEAGIVSKIPGRIELVFGRVILSTYPTLYYKEFGYLTSKNASQCQVSSRTLSQTSREKFHCKSIVLSMSTKRIDRRAY